MNRMNKVSELSKDTVTVDEAYENLANAIVISALNDYQELEDNNTDYISNDFNKKELDEFFNSDWYQILTNVDKDVILKTKGGKFARI